MGGSSASEVFSSPEASGALTGAASGAVTGFMVGGPVGAVAGAGIGAVVGGVGANQGAKAAKEQEKKNAAALEAAKNLETSASSDTTSKVFGGHSSIDTQQTQFAGKSKAEKQLQQASIDSFKKQQSLVAQGEADIKANQKLESQAQKSVGSVLGGQAFNTTASETARINALRDANVAVGENSTNKMLDERLAALNADAARRGIRGQAVSQLQTGALAAGAESLDRNTLEANRIAAEQAISMPGQRVGIQAQTAGNFSTFADDARQRAIDNRAALQDPVALQQLRDERLKGGKTVSENKFAEDTTTTTGTKSTAKGEGAAQILAAGAALPGQQAGGMAGAMGAIGAAGQVAGAGAQIGAAMRTRPATTTPSTTAQPGSAGAAGLPPSMPANTRIQPAR